MLGITHQWVPADKRVVNAKVLLEDQYICGLALIRNEQGVFAADEVTKQRLCPCLCTQGPGSIIGAAISLQGNPLDIPSETPQPPPSIPQGMPHHLANP